MFLTYTELHNNTFYDLLSPTSTTKIDIKESAAVNGRGVHLAGVTRVACTSSKDLLALVAGGNKHRATAATNLNERSSRSHAVMTIEVERMAASDGDGGGSELQCVKMGKMNIVDLAGSERVQLSGVTGEALVEASAINASLSALGDVLNALSKLHKSQHQSKEKAPPSSSFIPFRNSKLTHLLKDSLGGNCKTCMIATVRPGSAFYGQSLSTLR